MDAKFALMSLVCGIGSTIVLSVALVLRRERGDARTTSVLATLLWVATAFAQNVALTWLASLAYAAFAVTFSARLLFGEARPSGHLRSVVGVVLSACDVVYATGLLDLAILVVLALVEKVIPYYVALV